MQIKIKSLVVELNPGTFHPELTPIEHAALVSVWSNCVKKAWTPLVGALETTGNIPEKLDRIIWNWALGFTLGDRSKKVHTLAKKYLKVKIENQIKENRYNLKEAKESGLIENTIEKYIDENHEMWLGCVEEAKSEVSPEDQLDPLPVEQKELDMLLRRYSVDQLTAESQKLGLEM